MGFLLFLFVFMVTIRILANSAKNVELEDEVVVAKQCPPHKWKFVEIKDTDGAVVGTRIVCQLCGPLKSPGERESMDY